MSTGLGFGLESLVLVLVVNKDQYNGQNKQLLSDSTRFLAVFCTTKLLLKTIVLNIFGWSLFINNYIPL